MKVETIATEIFMELGEPSSLTIPSISYYIRAQVGHINNLLFEDFLVEETSGQYQILDSDGVEITPEAVSVIKAIYRVHEYGLSIRSSMNAVNSDSILEFTDGHQGSSIKRQNRVEQSKVFASLKAAEQQNLNDLVMAYRMKNTSPDQVTGDDIYTSNYGSTRSYSLRNWGH